MSCIEDQVTDWRMVIVGEDDKLTGLWGPPENARIASSIPAISNPLLGAYWALPGIVWGSAQGFG